MKKNFFLFDETEKEQLKDIVRCSYLSVKKKFPSPTKGESKEEYREFIRDEMLLEIADRLKEMALKRQKERIETLYKGIGYDW